MISPPRFHFVTVLRRGISSHPIQYHPIKNLVTIVPHLLIREYNYPHPDPTRFPDVLPRGRGPKIELDPVPYGLDKTTQFLVIGSGGAIFNILVVLIP